MKALALISGGLDSVLAAKLVQAQGVRVIGLHFQIPFASNRENLRGIFLNQKRELSNAGIKIKSVELGADFLMLAKNPRYGYGANLNPCIDCRILMLTKARLIMKRLGAKFVITGEVLGQRPMSQNRQALGLIEKQAGLLGLILRPLSAGLMPESLPERQGWIDRKNLLAIQGRSRRTQIALAEKLNIKHFFNPAGGCLLTDARFSEKLKDLLRHKEFNLRNTALLKVGRHFRLSSKAKLAIGRDEQENKRLVKLAQPKDHLFMPYFDTAGPTALGRGVFTPELIKLASSLVCRYCDRNGRASVRIIYKKAKSPKRRFQESLPIDEDKLACLRI